MATTRKTTKTTTSKKAANSKTSSDELAISEDTLFELLQKKPHLREQLLGRLQEAELSEEDFLIQFSIKIDVGDVRQVIKGSNKLSGLLSMSQLGSALLKTEDLIEAAIASPIKAAVQEKMSELLDKVELPNSEEIDETFDALDWDEDVEAEVDVD